MRICSTRVRSESFQSVWRKWRRRAALGGDVGSRQVGKVGCLRQWPTRQVIDNQRRRESVAGANRIDDPAYAEVKRALIAQLHREMKRVNDPLLRWFERIRDVY